VKGTVLPQTTRKQLEPLQLTGHSQSQQLNIPVEEPLAVATGRPLYRRIDNNVIAAKVILALRSVTGLTEDKLLAAEQYRLLCTRILEVSRNQCSKIFLVTSAIAEEGKTLTSMNLAYGLSHVIGKRVLLVELDLRRPSMHKLLGLHPGSTETTFLESTDDWRESLWELRPNLNILLAMNPSLSPGEMIQGERMRRFLSEARDEYDFIIVDSAPLLVAADTHALLPVIDHALMVVRADHTPINCARDALAILGNKALGCILNDLKKLKYGEHYSRYYITGTSND
jgi:succinoglycan biosynthesis transport protein ExoP